MKMSVYIDQYIGTEIFPGLPTSRRFNNSNRAIVVTAAVTLPRLYLFSSGRW
jgi:hypothetical protein